MTTQNAAPSGQSQPQTPKSEAEATPQQETLARAAELILVILLSITTLAAAFSAYQGASWGTQMSLYLGQANTRRVLASRATDTANQLTQVDVGLFTNWLNASVRGEEELADIYVQRFRAEFLPAFEAWQATNPLENPDAPKSPFAMEEYQLAAKTEAEKLDQEAADLTTKGMAANDKRDAFALSTVLLATVLFFVGMSQRLKSPNLKIAMIFVGAVIFLSVAIWIIWLILARPT